MCKRNFTGRMFGMIAAAVFMTALLLPGCEKAVVPENEALPEIPVIEVIEQDTLISVQNRVYCIKNGLLVVSNPDLTGESVLAESCDHILDISGGLVWYSWETDFYVVGLDGSKPKLLAEQVVFGHDVTNGWLYSENYKGDGLQRISKEDGRIEPLTGEMPNIAALTCDTAIIYDGFSIRVLPDSKTESELLMKCSPSKVVTIGDIAYISLSGTYTPNQLGGYTYTQGEYDQGCLFRYDAKSGHLEKLTEDYTSDLYPFAEGLFYKDAGGLFKWISKNNSKPVQLTDQPLGGPSRSVGDLGVVHVQDGWIYCTVGTKDFKLVRINIDTKRMETLADSFLGWASFFENKIYYRGMDLIMVENDDFSYYVPQPVVYRMNLDGSLVEKVMEFESQNPDSAWVEFPYLYAGYSTTSPEVYVKMKLDGSGRQTIDTSQMPAQTSNLQAVTGGMKFYLENPNDENSSIRYAKLDGSNDRVFYNKPGKNFVYQNGWLYFYSNKDSAIHRVRKGGTAETVVGSACYKPFILCGDYLVYKNQNEAICSVKTDGTGVVQLTTEVGLPFGAEKGKVFYIHSRTLYSVSLDGSDKQVLYTPEGFTSCRAFVVSDGWIYGRFFDNRGKGKLIRINCISGQAEDLGEATDSDIALSGQYVLYMGRAHTLCRLDTKGLSIKTILNGSVDYFKVMGDDVFVKGKSFKTVERKAYKIS